MEGKEKLKINIYPPELEILEDNKEKIIIKINENFTKIQRKHYFIIR